MASVRARQKQLERRRRKRVTRTEARRKARVFEGRQVHDLAVIEAVNGREARPKMSAVLDRFARPLVDACGGDMGPIRKALQFSVIVWNVAVMHSDDPDRVTATLEDEALRGWKDVPVEQAHAICAMMVRRKFELFPSDRRLILDMRVRDDGDNFGILVAHTDAGNGPSPQGGLRRLAAAAWRTMKGIVK